MEQLRSILNLVTPSNKSIMNETSKKIDNLTKPIGSLGALEEITIKLAGIYEELDNIKLKKNIVIMCADNGVFDENVSTCPQDVTWSVANNFTRGITGVSVLSSLTNTDLTIIDIGVNGEFNNPLIHNNKIMYGTNNIAKGPAMSKKEVIEAIFVGINTIDRLVEEGYTLFGTGEMGVGNTTTSAAVLSVLEDVSVDIATGKGSGLTNKQYIHKKNIIKQAIKLNNPDKNDVIDVIAKVGGLDIAGLCGCYLGAAKNKVPIVIDGFISSVAALCAFHLAPDTKDYTFPSHLSAEPGAIYVMERLGLEPMLHLKMRLGEGSGCPLAFTIIESAIYTMLNMGTFEDAKIEKSTYIDIRKQNL